MKRDYYEVITPDGFSNIYTSTLEEALKSMFGFGECPDGTEENKAYWRRQKAKCGIERVIEERVTVEVGE